MESATGKFDNPVTMKASEFKAKCLQLMDDVAAGGGEVIITKHGRPISRLVPYRTKPSTLFGIDRGRIQVLGDIVEPVDVVWEAETDPGRSVAP
ncbi:MAG: type II toxin-antitoxin system prevent-host-death family antitoxin [Acidobacteriia bacterium]|nr:type II toxin-antitoxin system prevent-host-death family antitoxin [Terriglobia bacterium]MYG04564.1 type II toxin-antitoxin system prevent-host-death family antitoxin [Terriglobia bacterium]MYK11823.1 type II toxin-antitoxin system prevent-host-death family antitoxin [Terriglobia bacterium]